VKKLILKLNKEWHMAHQMPENATIEERITWHLEHSKKCGCRPIPDKLNEEIKKRNTQ
jgi:hypothetical protein